MTPGNNLTTRPVDRASLAKRMLGGAAIGLILILFFVLSTDHPDPAWGKLWMIRPMIVVPFAGAMGGLFYYFMNHMRHQKGWNKILTNLVCLIVFIIGLWMGIVLGLDGTLWD